MVTVDLIKQYLVCSVELGYDVNRAVELIKDIKCDDDISKALHILRCEDNIRECYYNELSIDDIVNIINSTKACNKFSLLKSLERKLKDIV